MYTIIDRSFFVVHTKQCSTNKTFYITFYISYKVDN